MKSLKNLLMIAGLSLALSGCPTPIPNPTPVERLSADITYEVDGAGCIGYVSMSFGAIDSYGNGGLNEYMSANPPLFTIRNKSVGSLVMLQGRGFFYDNGSGTITVIIKDDGKKVVEKEFSGTGIISWPLDSLDAPEIDYLIPIYAP